MVAALFSVSGCQNDRNISSSTDRIASPVSLGEDIQNSKAIAGSSDAAFLALPDGTVYKTTDAGAAWGKISTPPLGSNLFAVRFQSDGLHGIAVGDLNTLLYTVNGGKSWERAQSPTAEGQFVDAWISEAGGTAWAAGEDDILLRSEDRGRTWHRVVHKSLSEEGYTGGIEAVRFDPAGKRGVLFAQYGDQAFPGFVANRIFWTSDGGRNWRPTPTIEPINDLFAIWVDRGCARAVAVGKRGKVISSDDGGIHWKSEREVPGNPDLLCVAFNKDGRIGVAGSRSGVCYFTVDGGKSWRRSASLGLGEKEQGGWFRYAHVNQAGNEAWLINTAGRLFRSIDGGESWTEIELERPVHPSRRLLSSGTG